MILVAVDFDGPIALPGKRAESTFPPPTSGWAGHIGWKMYIEDGRLCIVSPPGEASLNKAAAAEMEANGVPESDARHLVSVPLHRCTLRYVGKLDGAYESAPSAKLEKQMRGEEKPPAPALVVMSAEASAMPAPVAPPVQLPKKKPPPQSNAPQPLRRSPGPPGAKPMVIPPVSKEIEMDGEAPKAKRAVMALEVERE